MLSCVKTCLSGDIISSNLLVEKECGAGYSRYIILV